MIDSSEVIDSLGGSNVLKLKQLPGDILSKPSRACETTTRRMNTQPRDRYYGYGRYNSRSPNRRSSSKSRYHRQRSRSRSFSRSRSRSRTHRYRPRRSPIDEEYHSHRYDEQDRKHSSGQPEVKFELDPAELSKFKLLIETSIENLTNLSTFINNIGKD